MKLVISSVAFVACFSLSTFVSAQGRGQAGGPPAGHGGGVGHAANTRTETKADIGQKITDHPKLASKLQSLLPAGNNVDVAVSGFKNMGQLSAAVHVSHKLNI